jgi:hypothetical protein
MQPLCADGSVLCPERCGCTLSQVFNLDVPLWHVYRYKKIIHKSSLNTYCHLSNDKLQHVSAYIRPSSGITVQNTLRKLSTTKIIITWDFILYTENKVLCSLMLMPDVVLVAAIYIYIYIYKDLLHINQWRLHIGLQIVPMQPNICLFKGRELLLKL